MFNLLLITAVFLLFSHFISMGFEKCQDVNKNLTALCPYKKMTLIELHFSVQIPLQLKMCSTALEF